MSSSAFYVDGQGQVGNDFSLDGNLQVADDTLGKAKLRFKHVIRKMSGRFGGLQTV